MPEFYTEPMKDRKTCSVCQMTAKEKGKKVLLTCIKCHAITYCGVECQSADWARHEWNCVPVMVTEIQGKGRGLVSARDIKKAELIFIDKPVIKVATNAGGYALAPNFMTSLKQQIEILPTEARAQYYKLTTRNDLNNYNLNRRDWEVLNLFKSNSKTYKGEVSVVHLNIALVNHSCAPNATFSNLKPGNEDLSVELRAINNINKGEEITICCFSGFNEVMKLGSGPRKRKAAIKKAQGFDCKCPVCLGQVPGQEKTFKKLIELYNKLSPTDSATPTDWKREAGLWSRIVDLTMELYIGVPHEKIKALEFLVGIAHLARDKDIVEKAMAMAKQFVEEIKLEVMQRTYERLEVSLEKWSNEFRSNSAPEKREIDFFLHQHY